MTPSARETKWLRFLEDLSSQKQNEVRCLYVVDGYFLSRKCDKRSWSNCITLRQREIIRNENDEENERTSARNLEAWTNKINEGLEEDKWNQKSANEPQEALIFFWRVFSFFFLFLPLFPHQFFNSYYVVVRELTIKGLGQDAILHLTKIQTSPFS